jgi:hypothetical protein
VYKMSPKRADAFLFHISLGSDVNPLVYGRCLGVVEPVPAAPATKAPPMPVEAASEPRVTSWCVSLGLN